MIRESQATRLLHRGFANLRYALEKHQFLEKHSRVVVAVSGGIDSLVLLFSLVEYNKKYCRSWDIHAVHINPRFPRWNTNVLKDFLEKVGVPHTIVNANIYRKITPVERKCFFCARERRRKLLEMAESLGVFHVALAHHQQDVVETLLMNLIYNGEIATCMAKQPVIRGRFFFIRPLYYFDKRLIRNIARAFDLPKDENSCPFGHYNNREKVRRFLSEIQKENPDVYRGIFKGMFNIKKAYLP